MTPEHHPSDDLLVGYAVATYEPPISVILATHLALCPRCRRDEAQFEELGGVMLEALPPQSLDESNFARAMARRCRFIRTLEWN